MCYENGLKWVSLSGEGSIHYSTPSISCRPAYLKRRNQGVIRGGFFPYSSKQPYIWNQNVIKAKGWHDAKKCTCKNRQGSIDVEQKPWCLSTLKKIQFCEKVCIHNSLIAGICLYLVYHSGLEMGLGFMKSNPRNL